MNIKRIIEILVSLASVAAVMPGSFLAAEKLRAYELVWLIPFLPAFTVTFFWIVVVMVGHFIAADSYKDPQAIIRARSFLVFFEWFFALVAAGFMAGGWFLYRYFIS